MRRGFTILELLIVIAVIALLASVILVALGETRKKGEDAGIKNNLSIIRTQAALYYEVHNESYCIKSSPPLCDIGEITGGQSGDCSSPLSVFWDDPSNTYSINPGIVAAANTYNPNSMEARCFMDDV